MLRRACIVFFLALAAWAANVKLYLKDGGYHLVREYQVQPDRVRFYSVERSEWEEIPLDLVDLKRTEAESAARNAQLEKEAKAISEEAKAQRELENEIARSPGNRASIGLTVADQNPETGGVHGPHQYGPVYS